MNEWETPACLQGGQRLRKPLIPARLSPAQDRDTALGTPQQQGNDAYTSQRVKKKQLELRMKDQRYLPDTLKLS